MLFRSDINEYKHRHFIYKIFTHASSCVISDNQVLEFLFMKKCFYIYFLFGCVIFFLAESCQPKGCTDKNALNFNSIARKKDGSCIYCDLIAKISGVDSIDLIDDNSASTHFNQVVARFYFTQTTKKFNDRGCGSNSCLIF